MTKLQRKYNHAQEKQKWWDKNTKKIYNLVMQHTMPQMNTKLLTMDSGTSTSTTLDGTTLLKLIHNTCHNKGGGTNATTILDLIRMDKNTYLIHQAPIKLLLSFLSKFNEAVNVVKLSDGSLYSHPAAT
jgi:hypothetical protein